MPGVTIDKFDLAIYIQYARRTELIEQVKLQYHTQEAGGIPAQAIMIDLYPKLSELELLMGVAAVTTPWAYFFPPKRFPAQRRSPFTFHRVVPIFGSADEQKEEEEKLEQIECSTEEEELEKGAIKRCFKQIEQLNDLMRYIGGRIGQFLQG
jgi:hypothetical protein